MLEIGRVSVLNALVNPLFNPTLCNPLATACPSRHGKTLHRYQ
jgi:hypothetical protein